MDKNEILIKIRAGGEDRESAIRFLYNHPQFRAGLKKVLYVVKDENEFNDILNLTLVQFMMTTIKNPEFTIKSNIHSYLFVIAKNIAIRKYNKNKLETYELETKHLQISDNEPTIDLKILFYEKMDSIKVLVEKMGRNCYEILWNWATGYSMKEIAKKLGYKSAEVARRKKFLCLKRLSQHLEENPDIKDSLNE